MSQPSWTPSLLAEEVRRAASSRLDPSRRKELGQFFTPLPVARRMAAMFSSFNGSVRLLDAGAGAGVLTACVVEEICGRGVPPVLLEADLFEIDTQLRPALEETVALCRRRLESAGIRFQARILTEDFLASSSQAMAGDLFCKPDRPYTHAILNPPYRKISSGSDQRALLSRAGLETSNLYSGFIFLACKQLAENGEVVAITPRSFCNGPYFLPLRRFLRDEMTFLRVHVFEARDEAFAEDDVLQENIIFHACRKRDRSPVMLSTSRDAAGPDSAAAVVSHDEVLSPLDPNLFIRLGIGGEHNSPPDNWKRHSSLGEIGLGVSTGRVVDFRVKPYLKRDADPDGVPLLYPGHFRGFSIEWPRPGFRKFNSILPGPETESLLVPAGWYVLVKRLTAKEERKRVVAVVLKPEDVPGTVVGIENHLNYYHEAGAGMEPALAAGLCAYLNSSLVDRTFREFSGHTQVNAADLRALPYPSRDTLRRIGSSHDLTRLDQAALDRIISDGLAGDV